MFTVEELLPLIFKALKKGGGGGGTSDYNNLDNKPSINGHTLSGNKTSEQLGIESLSVQVDNETLTFS